QRDARPCDDNPTFHPDPRSDMPSPSDSAADAALSSFLYRGPMSLPPATIAPFDGRSVCLFCGSSDGADPQYVQAASAFGKATAQAGWRLVYGGGGVGLMGASARAAHEAGGRVVGIMPAFLRSRERLFDDVETVVVTSMHER